MYSSEKIKWKIKNAVKSLTLNQYDMTLDKNKNMPFGKEISAKAFKIGSEQTKK